MSASATAALIYNTVPVFADIEEEYFCLDPKSIEERITDRTKAIIVVDLFGQPYDADRINTIAKKNDLPHPHLSIQRLQEDELLVSQGDGTFTWNKPKGK